MTQPYIFSPAVHQQLDDIYNYTYDQWNKTQADSYVTGLFNHLEKLSQKKAHWHKLPDHYRVPPHLKRHIYFSRYEMHIIFFCVMPSGKIGIMSILHQSMDLPIRLKEGLGEID